VLSQRKRSTRYTSAIHTRPLSSRHVSHLSICRTSACSLVPSITTTKFTSRSSAHIPAKATGDTEMAVYRHSGDDEPEDIDDSGPDRATDAVGNCRLGVDAEGA